MKVLKAFAPIFFILTVLGYLVGAFVEMSFNPSDWPQESRVLLAMLVVPSWIFSFLIVLVIVDDRIR